MYLIQSQIYKSLTLEQAISMLTHRLAIHLSRPCKPETVIKCAEHFIKRLNDNALLPDLDEGVRQEIIAFCHPDALCCKIERELGSNPFSLRRINFCEPHFESWRPLGVVVHITPSNAPLLPFFAILESLLVGNINWLRPSSSEQGINIQLLQAFLNCDDSGELANFVAVLPAKIDELPQLLTYADGVSAWGGDTALEAIRKQLPAGCRWIDWGHKISFAYLEHNILDAHIFEALADEICRFDQQACSSPQIVFVDSDDANILRNVGNQLAQAMLHRQKQWSPLIPNQQEAADITTCLAFTRMDEVFADIPGKIWAGDNWRIIWKHVSAIEPSPLFRTVLLRPLPQQMLLQALHPWRTRLQTCGLAVSTGHITTLSHLMLAAGVDRITSLQKMHESYAGEPHDGVYALTRLARRVSVTLATNMLPRQATLNLNQPAPAIFQDHPIMDKTDFQNSAMQPCAQLFFRSGGSSGTPKLSGFTYRDYHSQMQAAADGLFAAGLNPASDRVLNLMYGGNLYGGLLSLFTVLNQLEVPQYPMGGPHDGNYSDIAQLIVNQQIDTLIGMPGTIYQLFLSEDETLRAYGGIKKLMLAGEHMGSTQHTFLTGFGINTICSALYGSVDAGPLGHACTSSPKGIFHLMTDIQWLEIVDLDHDEPVAPGESGRMLFTSITREGQKIIRYEIGDIGRWIEGECACGVTSPRFELLGRHGDLIRIGTLFIQPQQLAKLANVPVQFILEYSSCGCELIRLLVDGDADSVRRKICTDADLITALDGDLLKLDVCSRPLAQFERHPHSGKNPLVIDKRR
ncbi:acyl-CoA reductase family protein [Yersinia rochesterensis]|uniref:long-chain-fatty-acyl-CoA reductase n=1 Tax=Yersinia rochesterensis TaxID=1604335 RepID=A0ABN4FE52_9GAMM|nr:acyl-CoA reductase [Yersinia rochesterensis]AIN17605.1 acyl-CoA reductase family protein [Yersinia rochesterensis]AJI88782.1 acyl-CoA reductase family protein [Yersinia frederiksenii Y225]AJJ35809.1 acyl-CoA reductase family protein [Yersinia rochesterensis]